jgi:hypothetical protein
VKGRNVLVSPCLKDRGPFIQANYLYIHDGIYMTSGARLEMVGSPRSVGGFHDVQACSEVLLVMRWTMLKKVPGVTALWDWLCFAAKFLWWPIWTGCLVPYSNLGPVVV